MKILNIRNAKWNEPTRRTFNCEISFDNNIWQPFTYNPDDHEPHVIEFRNTWLQENEHLITIMTNEEYQQKINNTESITVRLKRNSMLLDSDSYVLPDRWSVMSSEQQQLWVKYRQDLRDMPNQSGFPFNVEWPIKPQ